MDCETPPLRKLAYSGQTLAIYQLRDGYIRLDVGPCSIVLTHGDFEKLARIVEMAMERSELIPDGVLAGDGIHGAIWRCGEHGTLALEIDRIALRMAPTMLPVLHATFRTAWEALCQDADASILPPASMQYAMN